MSIVGIILSVLTKQYNTGFLWLLIGLSDIRRTHMELLIESQKLLIEALQKHNSTLWLFYTRHKDYPSEKNDVNY